LKKIKDKIQCYIADVTYGDIYSLKWRRGIIVDFIKEVSFIADKGYDSISVIQKILDIGLIPAIKMKQIQCLKLEEFF
jgi:hypothetical protein